MSLQNQIEAAIRSAGGDFSEASHAVVKILDEAPADGEASADRDEGVFEGDVIED